MAVVSELSRLVSEHHLMAVSELEQDMVTKSDRNNHIKVQIILFISLSILFCSCHTSLQRYLYTTCTCVASSLQSVESLVQNQAVRESDCLRLVMLFALRYEGQLKGGELERLMRRLEHRGVPEQKRRVSKYASCSYSICTIQ